MINTVCTGLSHRLYDKMLLTLITIAPSYGLPRESAQGKAYQMINMYTGKWHKSKKMLMQ